MLRFYDSQEYRAKQSATTKRNWEQGHFVFLRKEEKRRCKRKNCHQIFITIPSNPKVFCSSSCAAYVNNSKRIWPDEVKQKIALSLTGKKSPYKGVPRVARIESNCLNPVCGKILLSLPHKPRKFCSIACAMKVIGGRATSPRAARGKAGIRKDISPTIYFYSRWEANIARLYTYLKVKWMYAPTSFDLGGQTYTPDFYLPDKHIYVEVKNFWWKYSRERDEKFRKLYPHTTLEVLLKPDYLALERKYANLIPMWEYKNSPFKTV